MRPGTMPVLRRYRLERRIGGGGMAEVYEATDLHTGRVVAVKIALDYLSGDEAFVSRLRTEAAIVSRLSHPGIVALYDAGEVDGRPFLVMELIRGPSLRSVLTRDGSLSLARALKITAEILAALEHAHERGVLHRDVKPENVLLSPEGGAKLVDFGIAQAAAEVTVTSPGHVVGSPHYLAPERLTGSPASRSSDVYSVGVMLYQMLSGRLPFESDSPSALLAQQRLRRPTPLSESRPGLPGWVDRVVQRALAPEPAARYQSAAEMSEELESLGESQHREATTTLPVVSDPSMVSPFSAAGSPPSPRRGLRLGYPALAVMALLASFLLLGSAVRNANTAVEQPVVPTSAAVSAPTPAPSSTVPLPTRTAVPASTPVPEPADTAPQGDRAGGSGSAAEDRSNAGPPGLRNKPDKSDKKKRN